ADARDEAVLELVAADGLEAREQRGAAMNGVLLEDELGLDLVLRPGELLLGDRLLLELLHLLEQDLLQRLGRLPRHRGGPEPEQSGIEREVRIVAAGFERQPFLVDEVTIQARRPTAGTQGGERIERGPPRGL